MLINLLNILENTVDLFFGLLSFLLIARVLMSWVTPLSHGGLAQFIRSATDPILLPLRRLPLRIGLLDLTPIVALLLLDFIRVLLLMALFGLH
jgi:YggT family protein